MFKGTEVMGVTDYAKESAIDARIDELMSRVYREKYWKTDGDAAQIAAWQKEVDDLVRAQKAYMVKDDLWTQYMKNGGTGLNASTSQETTGYYVTLPSNKIELQMLMESDRMMNARFREFYSEKDVIMEERRLSENRPGYFFSEQVQAAFYTASPYHWDVIGWMDDLRKMTKEDLVAFHNTYYVPNNAVAIYVGDFDPQAVTAMAEKYFGRIPKGPDLEPIRTGVPAQFSEKRLTGEGPAPTSLQMMFHIPPDGDPDTAALSVLAGTLGSGGGGFRGGMGGGGGTGRLYKSLVRDKQLAVSASASSRPQWYVGAFQFNATPRVDKGVKPEDLEKEIWAEVERIKKEGLTEEEIQKAKNKGEAMFVRSLGSTAGLASRVGRAELKRGWRSILTDLDDLQKVTNDDIKRVAAKYFVKDNSLTAVYTRKSGR
jgi:predicted Zn-dependent peptidase